MAIREFTDSAGVRWQVWATTPSRGNVRPQFASGWLAFECGSERRRLAPFPPGWAEVDAAALCTLLAQATVVVRGSSAALLPAQPAAAEPEPVDAAPVGPAFVEPAPAVISVAPAAADPVPPGATVPLQLNDTVARVRALLREVEASWKDSAPG